MNYGFYTAASGAFTNMARMDVLSNNLANIDTVGFKPFSIGVRQREAARQEDSLQYIDSNTLLEKLGAGVMPTPTRISTSQGTLRETHRPLDVAIQGEGYLMVDLGSGAQATGLTRDGRMLLDPTGRLVHATTGKPILSPNAEPIQLEIGVPVQIRADGSIVQNDVEVARLGLINIPEPGTMQPVGGGTFRPTTQQMEQASQPDAHLVQGSVEDAAVNPLRTMMAVTTAGSSARSNLRMVSTINEIMGLAITRLGRVSN